MEDVGNQIASLKVKKIETEPKISLEDDQAVNEIGTETEP